MNQSLMCSPCFMTRGRADMMLRVVEPVIIVFEGESLCLDHAEHAQANAILEGRYEEVGGTEELPEFKRVREG